MNDFERKAQYGVEDLRKIVRILRAPGGCPWDQAQTHESIRRNFIEEACEVAEAIDQKDPEHLKEELGDVLLQVLFHSSIEEDAGRFTLDDVADGICKKLIYRHPHVFAREGAPAEDWETLKRREKGQRTHTQVLEGVARTLPGLWRAEKLQDKAAQAGVEWPDVQTALDKLGKEAEGLKAAAEEESNVEEALGGLLFTAVSAARLLRVDADAALGAACEGFLRRFAEAEAAAAAQGFALPDFPASLRLDLMDRGKDRETKDNKERET